MEYRSPLGSNFKLQQSLSVSKADSPKGKDSSKGNESFTLDKSGKGYFESNNWRNSIGRNYSPSWQRHSDNWKSPNQRNSILSSSELMLKTSDTKNSGSPERVNHTKLQNKFQNEPVPVEQLYHPSMLENPWAELEKN